MTETTTQPGTVAADWTADPQTCRSNSSALYLRLVSEVARLIRGEAHALIRGNTEAAAGLILSQLAHVHGLAPSYRVPGQVTVSLDDLRLVTCSPEDGPPAEEYPGALRRLRAAVGAGTLDQRPASDPSQPSAPGDPPPAGLDVEPAGLQHGEDGRAPHGSPPGTWHHRPDGTECPYMASVSCNKCGWADPVLSVREEAGRRSGIVMADRARLAAALESVDLEAFSWTTDELADALWRVLAAEAGE